MGIVYIDNLESGMLLAEDVHDRNGRLLLRRATKLSEKNIHVLRTWGVIEVDIAGVEDICVCPPKSVVDPGLLASAEESVKPLFRHADMTHPCMSELFRLCVLRRVEHVGR